jgi:hypothetical protein
MAGAEKIAEFKVLELLGHEADAQQKGIDRA